MGKKKKKAVLKIQCWKRCCLLGQHGELGTCSAWVQRSREPSQPEQGLLAPSLGWVPAQVIALCPLKFLPAVSTECYLFFFASAFENKPIVSIIGTEVAAAVEKAICVSTPRCYLM